MAMSVIKKNFLLTEAKAGPEVGPETFLKQADDQDYLFVCPPGTDPRSESTRAKPSATSALRILRPASGFFGSLRPPMAESPSIAQEQAKQADSSGHQFSGVESDDNELEPVDAVNAMVDDMFEDQHLFK